MLLYNSPISGNCYKVRLLAAHLGVPLELENMDVIDRSDPREQLAGLSPTRRLPTLVLDDGRPLAESNAIIWYLGEGSRFVPDDPYARAQALQWMFFEQYEHEPGVAVARFLLTYSGRADEFAGLIEERRKQGIRALKAMERHLEEHEWLVGDGLTVADIALYAYTHAADEAGIDLAGFPAIRAWLDRVAAEPGHVPMDA